MVSHLSMVATELHEFALVTLHLVLASLNNLGAQQLHSGQKGLGGYAPPTFLTRMTPLPKHGIMNLDPYAPPA